MSSKTMKRLLLVAATFAAVACSNDERGLGTRDDEGRDYAARDTRALPPDADNTGRNVRDRDADTVTPMDQSNTSQDIDLTQKIRSGITSNDAMSIKARNVKVISQAGVVTLRGPVESEQEKASIETLARNSGATRIENQLEIDRDADPAQED